MLLIQILDIETGYIFLLEYQHVPWGGSENCPLDVDFEESIS